MSFLSMNASQKKNQTLAVTSMVLGILSLVPFSIVAGIPAVIAGHIARSRIQEAPEQYGGGRLALAGLIMGYVSMAVAAVGLVLLAVSMLPSLLPAMTDARSRNSLFNNTFHNIGSLLPAMTDARSRAQAQSVGCINNLKQVSIAIRLYAADHQGVFPASFMQITNQLGSPTVLICPLDPQRSGRQREWNPDRMSYEFLKPGEEQSKVMDEAIVSCPFHGHVVAGDGTVAGGAGKR